MKQDLHIRLELSSAILREGLVRVLAESPFAVCLADGPPELCPAPDIVILDPPRCDEQLSGRFPRARLVLIDTGLRDHDVKCLLACRRICGIIAPDTGLPLFFKAITTVHRGQIWIDQRYLQVMLGSAPPTRNVEALSRLSAKDLRIVLLIADGCKNREIADQVCLSEATIKSHLSRIFRTLGVSNRAQLVCLALENGLLSRFQP